MIHAKCQSKKKSITSKYLIALFLVFLLLSIVLSVHSEGADDANVSSTDDYEYYKISDDKVSVSGLKNTSLTVIDIPETVVISSVSYKVVGIMDGAFQNKTGITSVSIPNTTISIGQLAFGGCTGITDLTIGNGVKSIGMSAFIRCTHVTNLSFNAKECNVGDSAFSRLGSDGAGVVVSFGDSVENIPLGIFNNTQDRNINIISVNMGKNVKSIGDSAFNNCTKLESISIPDSVTAIGNNAFAKCSNIVSITMGKNVESIGDSAFNNCTKLESISIPDSVTTIGNNAFYNCSALKNITIGKGAASIGEAAFSGCKSLMKLYFDAIDCNVPIGVFHAAGSSGTGVDVRFGDNVKNIPDNIFYTSSPTTTTVIKIKSIAIGKNVETIGERAFCNTIGLKDIVITEGVKTIESEAFRGCNQLEYLFVPGSLTTIGDRTFSLCSSLKYINFGNLSNNVSVGIDVFTYEGEYAYQFFNVRSKEHFEFNADNVNNLLFSKHSYFYNISASTGFLVQRCEITLDPNGGSCGSSIVLTNINGAIEGNLPVPTRDGYTFKGWYNGSKAITSSDLFTENTTIVANWEPVPQPQPTTDSGSNTALYICIVIVIVALLIIAGFYIWKKRSH